jgi:hypothetical protein
MGVQTNQSKLSAVVRFTYRNSRTICVTDPARAGRIPTVQTSSKVPRARRDSTVHSNFIPIVAKINVLSHFLPLVELVLIPHDLPGGVKEGPPDQAPDIVNYFKI